MDRAKLLKLVDKIRAAGYSCDSETVLTVEEYFDGYDEQPPNICANTGLALTSRELRDILSRIESKVCVTRVLVRVYEFEDALQYSDSWVSSDMVFVVTTASVDEVQAWFESLLPTSVGIEMDLSRFNNFPAVPEGSRVIYVQWD